MSSVDISLATVSSRQPLERHDPHGWGFALLLMVVGALFLRPADFLPIVEQWPIYQCLIIACLIVASRSVWEQFSLDSLRTQPLTCCLFMLLGAIAVSHISRGAFWEARYFAWEFAKLLVLYLLIVGLLQSPQRLLTFVTFLTLSIATISALALLDQHGIVTLTNIEAVVDTSYGENNQDQVLSRIRWTGIFHDPNDLGLILVTGIVFACFKWTEPGIGALRHLWAIPLAIMMITLTETHSRGAFLSIVAVVPAWIWHRLGWRYALLIGVFAVPLMAVVFAGRMTELNSVFDGTGQSRIQIWSDTLQLIRQNPLFGVGQGMLVEELGAVSHNTFLQWFSEVGLIGGTLFVGVFLAAASQLKAAAASHSSRNDEIERFRGYCFAALLGYVVGLTTLSREFVGPTYLLLGLATATSRIRGTRLDRAWLVTGDLLPRALLFAGLSLVGFYLLTRLMVRW